MTTTEKVVSSSSTQNMKEMEGPPQQYNLNAADTADTAYRFATLTINTPPESENESQEDILDSCSEFEDSQNAKGLPEACLFVASLSASKTDEQLHQSVTTHFEQWGPLLHVKVLKDWLQRPYSFVQFKHVEDAKRALIEAHNTKVDDRLIRVEQARVNRTLFIARFNRNWTERHLRACLEKFGPLEEITVLQNFNTGKGKGCGFVKFRFREDAVRAYLNLRANSKLVAEWATNLDKGQIDVDRKSIFVGQLNQVEVSEEVLKEKFGAYGDITSVQLINKHRQGQLPRPAFAFITFENEEAAASAIMKENATRWLDRVIRVAYRENYEGRSHRSNSFSSSGGESRAMYPQPIYYPFNPSIYPPGFFYSPLTYSPESGSEYDKSPTFPGPMYMIPLDYQEGGPYPRMLCPSPYGGTNRGMNFSGQIGTELPQNVKSNEELEDQTIKNDTVNGTHQEMDSVYDYPENGAPLQGYPLTPMTPNRRFAPAFYPGSGAPYPIMSYYSPIPGPVFLDPQYETSYDANSADELKEPPATEIEKKETV